MVQYLKQEPNIINDARESNQNQMIQPNDLQNYILINKQCVNCINNRRGNAGCVVAKDGKILLVKYRRTHQISLPGGYRDYKHKDTFVASEEMRQALGYIVSVEDMIGDLNICLDLQLIVILGFISVILLKNKQNE